MNIIFAGTPDFAVPALAALLQSEHKVVAVYTQPDRPAGRGRKLQQGPVKKFALANQLDVFQPSSFQNEADLQQLQSLRADLMVVVAYGLLIPVNVLKIPKYGCLNIHASLLPRWRGAAPIQSAILAGDEQSGVTIMQMDEGLDTGDMLARAAIEIDPCWTAANLHDELAQLGAKLLLQTLDDLPACQQNAIKQDASKMTYAPRLIKSQATLDWGKNAETILREIRAYVPWPVSYTHFEGQTVRIWKAQMTDRELSGKPGFIVSHDKSGVYVGCGDAVLQIIELQFSGKNKNTAAQALNARNLGGLNFE